MRSCPARYVLVALLLAGAPVGARAQSFAYAPGTTQYVLTVHSSAKTNQMGNIAYDMQERMTLTVARRSPDTLGLTITLDSVTGKLPTGAPINGTAMLGIRLNASMSPAGRIYSRDSSSGPGVQSLGQFADELYRFLPVLPPTLTYGSTWADTVSSPINEMGTKLTRSIITSYRVLGDTAMTGETAWRIQRAAAITVAGTGSAAGQEVRFETTGAGTGVVYVTRGGRYLGEDLRDELQSKATLPALGKEVANSQTQTTKVTLVR